MNLRYEILKACAANPGAPVAEICDSIKHDRQKTTWAVRDCAKAGLLSMRRDDVTGQPGYALTADGKQRLAEGPGSKQGGNMKKADSDSEGGEADVKAQSAKFPPQITPEIPPTEAGDDAMPPADASLLALANRELADRLARVAHVLRGSGLEGLKDLDDGADLQTAAAALTGAYQMALANLQSRGEQFLEMQDELNRRDDELLAQASTIVDLRSQLETLQREAMRGASLMSGQDRYTAAGYLVRATKRKPRTLLDKDKDKARDAALSSIRAGAQRAEVFALVPIGHARRGVEWRSA